MLQLNFQNQLILLPLILPTINVNKLVKDQEEN